MAVKEKIFVKTIQPSSVSEVLGANSPEELYELKKAYNKISANAHVSKAVKFADIDRLDFRGEIKIGSNTFIDVNVIFEGEVNIGKNCFIGAGSIIKDSVIQDGVVVEPNSLIENSLIGSLCKIGPFAHIGPEAKLESKVEIGNFVEVKRSKIGKNTKAKHLAYIGDGEIGESVNIGAGTIFVNYDGKKKSKTKVGSGAFIGSNSSLVAPLKIGKNSMIGAGSVVTNDVPENKLALGRSRQRNIKRK